MSLIIEESVRREAEKVLMQGHTWKCARRIVAGSPGFFHKCAGLYNVLYSLKAFLKSNKIFFFSPTISHFLPPIPLFYFPFALSYLS